MTYLSTGPDPHGRNTRRQVDSLNHTVQYLVLEDAGQVRFSMENKESSKKGTNSPGVLVVKFQDFTIPSNKVTISVGSNWNSQSIIVTFGHYVLMLGDIGTHKLDVTTDLEGCRSWTKAISTVGIQAHLFHLNVADPQMGWETFSTTLGLYGE
ncbi:hypothetical protein MMC31_007517 [Peltigera leucophlebia]|nr:hypothetical protein [Peltigera leucophlebia]